MPELRWDPTLAEWVLLAPERAERPHGFAPPTATAGAEAAEMSCPFCPGNEAETPPEVARYAAADGGWLVRAFPNRFPALTPDAPRPRGVPGAPYRARPGRGHHEVIVETPRHAQCLADMAPAQLGLVLRLYRERFRALAAYPGVREVLLFRNEGEAAGASLAHAHAQVVGLPLQSPLQRRRQRVARDHFRRHGQGPCQALRERELAEGVRLVARVGDMMLLHPYASRALHETWLIPMAAGGSLAEAGDALLDDAASALGHAARLLRAAVGRAAFNVVVHSGMPRDAARPELLWYMQLIPRLTRNAGFEFTSGFQLSAAAPEATAAQWRALAGQVEAP